MPFFGLQGRKHRAVLWECTGSDRTGRPVVSTLAVPLRVRWDADQRIAYSSDGSPIAVDAVAVVDRDIQLGSAMWLGDVDDLPGDMQLPNQSVYEVKTFSKVADYSGRRYYREVGLLRGRDLVFA